jgi:8-oxo-dGTP pyrophosphatase MutT (NUDIX family)
MTRTTVHRVTARVLPVNASGEVLLLHGWDPAAPDAPYWFSVGGACEPGETLAQAAARELLEETGIVVASAAFGEPIAIEAGVEFDWGPYHLVQDQSWFAVALESGTEVHFRGLEPLEVGTIDEARWWTPDALDADGSAASDRLTEMMRRAVEVVLRGG